MARDPFPCGYSIVDAVRDLEGAERRAELRRARVAMLRQGVSIALSGVCGFVSALFFFLRRR